MLKHWRYNNLTPSQQNLVIQIGQWFRAKATVLCYTNELGLVGISLLYLQCWSIGDTTTWHPANKIHSHPDRPVVSGKTNSFMLHQWTWVSGNQFTLSPVLKHWRYNNLTPSQQNLHSHPDRPVVLGKSNSFMLHQWTWVSGNQFTVSPVLEHWRYNNLTPSQQNLQSSR